MRHQQSPELPARSAAALVDPIIEHYDLPMLVGVVSALAAPGLLPFTFLGYSPMSPNLHTPASLVIIALLTTLVWYAAGRWIDRRLGYVARRAPLPGRLQQVLNWSLLAAWIGAVSAVTAELIAIDFMEIMRWMAAGIVCWGTFVTFVLVCRIREQQRYTRSVEGQAAQQVSAT